MDRPPSRLNTLFSELRRRHVFRVAAAYGVVAWLLIQVAATTFPHLGLPDWGITLVIALVLLSFPVALLLAWAFELTPEGFRRTGPPLPALANPGASGSLPRRPLVFGLALALLAGAGWAGYARSGTRAVVDRSIAVLPFANMSASEENAYFADGITDEVLTQLSKVGALEVISRTSVMGYKGTTKPLKQIGAELGAAYVLEGSVQRAGDRVRITAQLIHAGTDRHVWAERYDRDLADVFAVQSEIATEIAGALRAELTPEERERIARAPTQNLAAYELYLRGRHFWSKDTPEGIRRGMEYFRQAIDADPLYAPAYAGLADGYTRLHDLDQMHAEEAFPKGEAAAGKALALDEHLPEAHASLAHLRMHQWRWTEAEQGYRRALELNPNYTTARLWYAIHLMSVGRTEESMRQVRAARRLDPLSAASHQVAGLVLSTARRPEEAVEAYRSALELVEDHPGTIFRIAQVLIETGRYEEGMRELRRVYSSHARPHARLYTARALALSGSPQAARDTLRAVLAEGFEGELAWGTVALAYAALGDRDHAFEALQRLVPGRSPYLCELGAPAFDGLRTEPRFMALRRQMGLQ